MLQLVQDLDLTPPDGSFFECRCFEDEWNVCEARVTDDLAEAFEADFAAVVRQIRLAREHAGGKVRTVRYSRVGLCDILSHHLGCHSDASPSDT